MDNLPIVKPQPDRTPERPSLSQHLSRLWRTFLAGLVAIIPVAVTIYLIFWLFSTADSLFSGIGRLLLPQGWYFPGLGLVIAALVVLGLGAILNTWVVSQAVLNLSSRLFEHIPLVKTVYTGLRDLMLFVSRPQEKERRHVVLVTLPSNIRLIGFITDTAPALKVPELRNEEGEKVLAVYLPMSYQIGGYTLYLPERHVERLEMSVEDAMRMVLTAGM